MLYFTFFCTITLLIYFLFVLRSEVREKLRRRVAVFLNHGNDEGNVITKAEKHQGETLAQRVILPYWLEFKRSFKRRMPGEKEAKLEIKLLQAGNPFGMTPVEFRLLQIALFLTMPFLFGGYGFLLKANVVGIVMFVLLGIITAIYLPHFYIQLKTKARNKLALRELPDVLDLLTVSLEAGLGFDSALGKVVSKKDGVLSSEFQRCLEEIRLGKTRREALRGVRERLKVEEISVLISSILQAEKLGIGMVQVLRIQSAEVREQRKQRAEEEAMKAPIKMLFPLVLFIFPSLFIVLLGPAVIEFLLTFQD
ncbi:type II secretion system F family protein [Calidifontibacillus oryziterrae]|uniref:type II secretion system F family protein n=1 Tax=Calidifontibacillus oryziterrae TaxID=1191699 RepID=UPI0002D8C59C|nr:type II secretion system F family protein [Calidifontibacillus oryziterrae]